MRTRNRLLCWVLFLAVAAPVAAAPPRFYLGATTGDGIVGGEVRSASLNLPSSGDDRSYKFFGGVGLGRNFAVELGYHDFGNREAVGILDFGYDLDLTAYSGSVVWLYPLRKIDLFAKGGWMRWEEDGTTVSLIGVSDHNATGSNLLLGGGVLFGLGERFALRAEWERFDFDAGAEDAFSAGVELRF